VSRSPDDLSISGHFAYRDLIRAYQDWSKFIHWIRNGEAAPLAALRDNVKAAVKGDLYKRLSFTTVTPPV